MRTEIAPLAIAPAEAAEFIARYARIAGPVNGLSDIRAEGLRATLDHDPDGLLSDITDRLNRTLNDPNMAFAALDIPSICDDPQADALHGCTLASAIQQSISAPVIDRHSATPFSLYNASQENENKLVEAGLKFYSPEDRLGFHSDGLITDEGVHVPKVVSIYNLMIAYRKPGNFYFLPTALWEEMAQFRKAFGINRDITFSMTPIVHALESGEIRSTRSAPVTAPLFWQDGSDEAIFYNGEIDTGPTELIALADRMRQSLLENPARLSCPIRNRRMFLLANDKGFHARDIFADPVLGARYTRSFLRYVSGDAHLIKPGLNSRAA